MNATREFDRFAVFSLSFLIVGACGGGGGGGGGGPGSTHEVRAALGPLAGANVEVHSLATLGGAPLFQTTTSGGPGLASAGRFGIPAGLVADDQLYVITVRGGTDLDANDDGIADPSPTPNLGEVHALLTPAQIRSGQAGVTIASEVLYQRVRYFLAAAFPRADVVQQLDERARAMLGQDLDGDGDQDSDDVARFDPVANRAALKDVAAYDAAAAAIRGGNPPSLNAVLPLTEPRAPAPAGDTGAAVAIRAEDVAVVGTTIFVANSAAPNGLTIVDAADAGAPAVLGTAAVGGGTTSGVDVVGSRAYLAKSASGLQIFDVGNPAAPALLGSIGTIFVADVVVAGNLAYVGEAGSLTVVDVPDPANPVIVGGAQTGSLARSIAIDGGISYVATSSAGLQLYDIATAPTAPAFLGAAAGSYDHVVARAGFVFASQGGTQLRVIDARVPAQPQDDPNAMIDTGQDIRGLALEGDLLYVANDAGGLRVVDVGDPLRPAILHTVATTAGAAFGVAVAGERAYVGTGSRLQVFVDRDSRAVPTSVRGTTGPRPDQAGSVEVAIDFPTAYVALAGGQNLFNALQVLDVGNPAAPQVLGEAPVTSSARAGAFSGSTVYVGTDVAGIEVVNAANPAAPQTVNNVSPPALVRGFVVSGATLFATGDGALRAFDLASALSPLSVSSVALPSGSPLKMDLAAAGRLYVADSTSGLQAVNASNPAALALEGLVPRVGSDQARSVDVVGSLAYVAYSASGVGALQVVDATVPQSPTATGSLRVPGVTGFFDVRVAQGYAYIGTPQNVLLIDVRNAFEPALWGRIVTPRTPDAAGLPNALEVRDGVGYVAADKAGLQIIRAAVREVP